MKSGPVGALRHHVTLRTFSVANDGRGGQVPTWSDTLTGMPAEIEPTNGREFLQGGAVQNAMGFRVRTRYHASLGPKARLYVEATGQLLEVLEVVNVGLRNTELIATCLEVDS